MTQSPALTIVKSLTNADDAVVDTAGEVIEYTITVDNTGNADLTGVVLTDTFAGGATLVSGDTNNNSILETTETWTYSADYVVTQADLNAGTALVNVASVDTAQTVPQQDDATSTVAQNPALTIVKNGTVPGGTANAVGEVVSWTIDVGNAGNAAVSNVTVTDPLAPDIAPVLSGTFNSGDTDTDNLLDVGETWHYTASHTVTQADLDTNGGGDGDIDNVATAHGTGAADVSDDATVPVAQTPPTGGDTTTLALDEEALGPGNPNATGTNPTSTAETAFDALSFTAGSSPLTTFAFSTDLSGLIGNTDGVAGNELVWVRDSATLITAHFGSSGGSVAITLTLTPPPAGSIGDFTSGDVTVTATLSDNLKHALDAGEQVLNLGSVQVIATATDGHSISDTVGVTVKDDIPLPIAPKLLFGSNVAGTSATAFLDSDNNIDNNVGADQLGTVRFPASLNPRFRTDFRRRADSLYGL